jgi:cobalt-zinc-cadmium efflux system outer membrane protein
MEPTHDRRAPAICRCALLALAAIAGCHCRREPTCIPAYERRVLGPLDRTGAFPTAPVSPAAQAPIDPPPASSALNPDPSVPSPQPPAPAQPPALTPAVFSEPLATPPPEDVSPEAAPLAAGLAPNTSPHLAVPSDLPGAEAGPLVVPRIGSATEAERQAALDRIYFPLPEVAGSPPAPPAVGSPIDLGDLQSLAMANSPAIRVAAAEVESARGLAIQAGALPNPEVGYQADTVNTLNTPGYHGAYVQQTFVTAGKLRLARSAAEVDFINAQVALRRSRIDVATAVRTAYFDALVAREKLRIQSSLARFTENVFGTQTKLADSGEAAIYEPLQLRVYVIQSRAAVVQAEQQYAAARRRLAAALGVPQMSLGELVGRPDMPIPTINYDAAIAAIAAGHTDVVTARNSVTQARRRLDLAHATPKPNIDAYVAVQRDYTFDPGATTVNVQVGGPIPVLNRNRGNIISAQAEVYQAEQRVGQVENDLTARFADAYARYESNRRFIQDFQPAALEDQVRTYRGIYESYRRDGQTVQFNDVIVAQQTLSTLLTQYLDLLGDQWQAVVDVAELLQVDDIYLLGETVPLPPLPAIDGDAAAIEQPPNVDPPQTDHTPPVETAAAATFTDRSRPPEPTAAAAGTPSSPAAPAASPT